jgi:hypothetical protein
LLARRVSIVLLFREQRGAGDKGLHAVSGTTYLF